MRAGDGERTDPAATATFSSNPPAPIRTSLRKRTQVPISDGLPTQSQRDSDRDQALGGCFVPFKKEKKESASRERE